MATYGLKLINGLVPNCLIQSASLLLIIIEVLLIFPFARMSFINMYAVFFKKKNSTRFLDINVFKFKLLMVDVFGSIRQISRRTCYHQTTIASRSQNGAAYKQSNINYLILRNKQAIAATPNSLKTTSLIPMDPYQHTTVDETRWNSNSLLQAQKKATNWPCSMGRPPLRRHSPPPTGRSCPGSTGKVVPKPAQATFTSDWAQRHVLRSRTAYLGSPSTASFVTDWATSMLDGGQSPPAELLDGARQSPTELLAVQSNKHATSIATGFVAFIFFQVANTTGLFLFFLLCASAKSANSYYWTTQLAPSRGYLYLDTCLLDEQKIDIVIIVGTIYLYFYISLSICTTCIYLFY